MLFRWSIVQADGLISVELFSIHLTSCLIFLGLIFLRSKCEEYQVEEFICISTYASRGYQVQFEENSRLNSLQVKETDVGQGK